MRTFAEAAETYCERREQITELNRKLWAIPRCEIEYRGSGLIDEGDEPSCILAYIGEGGARWFQATPEEQADDDLFCPQCRARMPLLIERYKLRKTLAGLMRSMRAAYRREHPEAQRP